MNKLHLLGAVCACALSILLSQTSMAQTLYGVSINGHTDDNPGPSSLYTIDETTGAGTLIGNIGYAVNALAFDPTSGKLYASTTAWSGSFNGLLQIDTSTGAATEIGPFGSCFWAILGLSFNSSGELFGWHNPFESDLVRINKTTGAATTVGESGILTGGHVMAFDNSDSLILVRHFSGDNIQYVINTTTGAGSITSSLSFDPGACCSDIHNTTGYLWAPAKAPTTTGADAIRVTDFTTSTFFDIDTDVEYLKALAFSVREATVVEIDINPGSDPNSINPKSSGVIPVAVLGSGVFDATLVDFSTVGFGPDEASPVHDGHIENVNGDGFADMVFHFDVGDTGIVCGVTDATLTGETFGGDLITGTDAVKTAGCQ